MRSRSKSVVYVLLLLGVTKEIDAAESMLDRNGELFFSAESLSF